MYLIVSLEHRFSRTPDGSIWTDIVFSHSFWRRYLEVFDHVKVMARVQDVAQVSGDWERSDGECVTFVPLPYYVGPWQYVKHLPQIKRAINATLNENAAILLRVASPIADLIQPILRHSGRPYGVEVVGDPYDVFAPGTIKHPLRPFFRWWFSRQLRKQCATAVAAAYVTAQALQKRYPTASGVYTTHYSSIELPRSTIVAHPRDFLTNQNRIRLIFIGTLTQLYKAPDILIDAVANCVCDGLDLSLTIVGDGKYRTALEERTAARNIQQRVTFLGMLPSGEAVYQQLDQADIFVLPSRAEGLPRAMIEAMARGLPCIGSTVGGIPELLPAEDMVPPGDIAALAHKIREVVADPERMARMSARNLEQAREYDKNILDRRRRAFYSYVRQQTIAWIERQVKSCEYYN